MPPETEQIDKHKRTRWVCPSAGGQASGVWIAAPGVGAQGRGKDLLERHTGGLSGLAAGLELGRGVDDLSVHAGELDG